MKEMTHELRPYTQETSYSCGAAAMLIAYHKLGIGYNEPTLILELGTSPENGTSLEAMFNHATVFGFSSEIKTWKTYKDLQKDIKKGVIIVAMNPFWNGEPSGHYVVVEDIEPDMIELADPGIAVGDWPNIMSKDEFVTKWMCDGYPRSYLLIRPK